MAFHVSSGRVDEKVRRLAALTGQSITGAIEGAVTEKLRRLEPKKPDASYVNDLKQMAAEIRGALRPATQAPDGADPYDENGLFG